MSGRWLVMAELEVNDPQRPDVLLELIDQGRFEARDDANESALVLSRQQGVCHTLVADHEAPSRITGQPFTLVAMYVDGRRWKEGRTMIIERTCPFCSEPSRVEVEDEKWAEYERGLREGLPAGTHGIQVIFSDLSADDREILVSGAHGECWDKAFGIEPHRTPPAEEES